MTFLLKACISANKDLVRIKEKMTKKERKKIVRIVALFYMFRVSWILKSSAFGLLRLCPVASEKFH